MSHDHSSQITLTITNHPHDLQVVALRGHDALNAPWQYIIELVSSDPCLDTCVLNGQRACLKPNGQHPGIHGVLTKACQIYAGASVSHYRFTLEPGLQRLAGAARQRLFVNLSVPQIIRTLLSEQDLTDFRFEHLHGVYPPRRQCAQHQESDLQLLQRLCAEEGIHFRCENQHVLFSDDPAAFAERPDPLQFSFGTGTPGLLEHLASPLRLQALEPGLVSQSLAGLPDWSAAPSQAKALPSSPLTAEAAWQQQRRLRQLERLRGEARLISGRSREITLHSGQVVRIEGHPEPLFNDHWLLVRIGHSMHQLAVLEGYDPWDVAAIVGNLEAQPQTCINHFDAIPWTLPYRPALPLKKTASGLYPATVVHPDTRAKGQLAVRFDWQSPTEAPAQAVLLERLTTRPPLQAGSRILLAFADNDPDQPVVCALADKPATGDGLRMSLDNQTVDVPPTGRLVAGPGQHLRLTSQKPLRLHGQAGSLDIGQQAIKARSCRPLQLLHHMPRSLLQDLRELGLVTQPEAGRPRNRSQVDNTPWYIVRMIEPGLEHLSRLDPQDILLEGRSDTHGRLGLSRGQVQQLAVEYARTPHQLCLIHPGHCVTLRQHLDLDDETRHQALLEIAATNSF